MVWPKHDGPPRDLEADSLLLPGDDGDIAAGGAAAGPASGSLRARHRPGLLGPGLLPETPPLDAAVHAFQQELEERNPITDGDFPLRALAQGLSMLSLDELRRLHLPTLPWQTGDDAHPGMLTSLRRKPWKAHYTSLVGFLISTGSLIAHLWCAVVACLLVVFVSQSCPANSLVPVKHECRLSETQNGLHFLGRLVVTSNWITFLSFLGSEVVFFRREAFLISRFHDDDAAPYNQLPTFITDAEHNHVLVSLRRHNKLARSTALGLLGMCIFNLILSCCLLLTPPERGGRYNGTRTLVTLVSNILLLARRVVQNARISNLSMKEDLALSLYQMKFRSFNDLRGRQAKAQQEQDDNEAAEMKGPVGPLSPLVVAASLKASGSMGQLSGAGGETPTLGAAHGAQAALGRGHGRNVSGEWEPLVVDGAAAGFGVAPLGNGNARPHSGGDHPGPGVAGPGARLGAVGAAPAPTRAHLLLSHSATALPPPPPSPPDML